MEKGGLSKHLIVTLGDWEDLRGVCTPSGGCLVGIDTVGGHEDFKVCMSALKCVFTEGWGRCSLNGKAREAAVVNERIVADRRNRCVDYNRFEVGTPLKRTLTEGFKGFGKVNGLKRRAFSEGAVGDVGDVLAELDVGERNALLKGGVVDGFKRIGEDYVVEFGAGEKCLNTD